MKAWGYQVPKAPQDLVVQISPDLKITHIEGPLLERNSLNPSELVGKYITQLYRRHHQLHLSFLKEAFAGRPVQYDWQESSKSDVYLHTRLNPIYDEQGNILMVYSITTDLTDRENTVNQLNETQERLTALVNSIQDIMFVLDKDQRHVAVFGQSLERYGISAHDLVGKTVSQASRGGNVALHEKYNRQALRGKNVVYEWTAETPVRAIHFQNSISPIRDAKGRIKGIVGIARDITVQKETAQRLMESEAKLAESYNRTRRILESISDGFVAFDKQWNFTYVNNVAEKVWGKSREELLGKNIWELYPESKDSLAYKKYHQAMRERRPLNFETYYKVRNAWYDIHLYPTKDGLAVYFADITARKVAQLEYERLLQEKEILLEAAADGIWGVDKNNLCTFVNSAAAKMLGYKQSELLGQDMHEIAHHHHRDGTRFEREDCHVIQSLTDGKKRVVTNDFLWTKKGTLIPVEYSVGPILVSKEVTGAVITIRDISQRQANEERINALLRDLQESQERLNTIIGNVPSVVWETWLNPDPAVGHINYISNFVEEMIGYTAQEWLSTPHFWSQIVHPEDLQRATAEEEEMIANKQGGKSKYRWIRKDGSIIWVETHAAVILDKQGKALGLRGVTTDITHSIEIEQRKDEFLSIASHELKTPLTTIKGFSYLLQEWNTKKYKDRKVTHFLSKMDEQVDLLHSLIQDLLDVSKIKAGKLEYNFDLFSLHSLVKEVVEDVQLTTETHKINLEIKHKPLILADRYRIGQVVTNLLTNAIKYSPSADKILVKVDVDKDNAVVSVQDFGIGIPKSMSDRIFDRYYRIEDKARANISGLGLGLYICADIIDRHRGKIWVESKPRHGSTFFFSIPLNPTIDED